MNISQHKSKLFKKKLAIFQHSTKVGCRRLTESTNESDDLLNNTPISSPSPQAETAMSWVGHFSVVTP